MTVNEKMSIVVPKCKPSFLESQMLQHVSPISLIFCEQLDLGGDQVEPELCLEISARKDYT